MPPKKRIKITSNKSKNVAVSARNNGKEEEEDETAVTSIRPTLSPASGKRKGKLSTTSRVTKETFEENADQRFWLMKAEPESRIENGIDVKFGIDDLMEEPEQTACWDGVRNYQARNFMRDQMRIGDLAFFYHSNCKPPGIAGIMTIVKEGYVDHTAFEKKSAYYDAKSSKDNPKWYMVNVKFNRKLKRYIPLPELKRYHLDHKERNGALKNVALFTKARLSVQPLTKDEFEFICSLENNDE